MTVSFQVTRISGDYSAPTAVAASPSSVRGTTDTPVSATVSGLAAGTTFFYRVLASGPTGTTVGGEQAFTTAAAPAPRTGVIIDPASMAPDDPGPEEPEAKRRGFRLYAND